MLTKNVWQFSEYRFVSCIDKHAPGQQNKILEQEFPVDYEWIIYQMCKSTISLNMPKVNTLVISSLPPEKIPVKRGS